MAPTETTTETDTPADETATETDDSYEVCMEPNGCHTLESVPETFVAYHQGPVDMMISLGQLDGLVAAGFPSTFPTSYFDQLPGVEVDLEDVVALNEGGTPDKEVFYELDVDVHLVGHHPAMEYFGLDETDLEELEENVAPFHGSWMRRPDYTDGHPYYGLYEGLDRYAEVFQTQARGEAFRTVHDDLVAEVESRLPALDERPNAALVFGGTAPEEFTPYRLSGAGANKEHFHTLGLSDAFEGTGVDGLSTSEGGTIDYETLLEIDPDSLLVRYHKEGLTREAFEREVVQHMADHPIGGELTAVQNDRVFRGGPIYCGPLHNLFMIERYATAYFPDAFDEDRLFDRQRVSDIVNGDI